MKQPSRQAQPFDSISALTEHTLFERRENHNFHNSYAQEQKMLSVVRNGDLQHLSDTLPSLRSGSPGILSHNRLRQSQNLFISFVTLLTRAAIEGGMPEETAFSLSDSLIQTSESACSPKEVDRLTPLAFETFTREVARLRHGRYSVFVEQALNYIHRHLHCTLNLTVIADAVGLSPCYLSRLFQKETGESIVVYIQRERVEAAKNMLRFSDYSTSEIGSYLSFGTQSYFIQIFRRHTGMTPAAWRKLSGHSFEKSKWGTEL